MMHVISVCYCIYKCVGRLPLYHGLVCVMFLSLTGCIAVTAVVDISIDGKEMTSV